MEVPRDPNILPVLGGKEDRSGRPQISSEMEVSEMAEARVDFSPPAAPLFDGFVSAAVANHAATGGGRGSARQRGNRLADVVADSIVCHNTSNVARHVAKAKTGSDELRVELENVDNFPSLHYSPHRPRFGTSSGKKVGAAVACQVFDILPEPRQTTPNAASCIAPTAAQQVPDEMPDQATGIAGSILNGEVNAWAVRGVMGGIPPHIRESAWGAPITPTPPLIPTEKLRLRFIEP